MTPDDDAFLTRFGNTFTAVVIARGKEYIWWGDRDENEGVQARWRPGTDLPDGVDIKDTKWPNDGGNTREDGKSGPVADLTYNFVLCPLTDGDIGMPALFGYARGGAKTGEQLNILLNQFNGPDYAVVLEFTGTKTTHNGNTYYVAKPKATGTIPPDAEVLTTLKQHHDNLKPLFS